MILLVDDDSKMSVSATNISGMETLNLYIFGKGSLLFAGVYNSTNFGSSFDGVTSCLRWITWGPEIQS